jgi:hypothetical protein
MQRPPSIFQPADEPPTEAEVAGLADVLCRRGNIAGRYELHAIVCEHDETDGPDVWLRSRAKDFQF